MSVAKFFEEQSDDHGGQLHWPGLHGLPVRGVVGPMTEEEQDEGYEVAYDFKAEEFNLAKPEDLARYRQVMDRIVNGWYVKHYVEHHRTPDGEHTVYLEWIQQYGQILQPRRTGVSSRGGSTIKRAS